ncbi:MAG TPA: MDR family oxidoreductase [Rubricoccaceae bacterium]|nr:MDR family oxidoreductase [Rubricoccaceae bacterium]
MSFKALVLHQEDRALRAALEDVDDVRLMDGDVLIDVAYSSLNYKDGLAVTGKGKIVRAPFPFVPGIDLAGTVAESTSPDWKAGDPAVLTGWGTGESRWGGFAQRARAHGEHLVRLPEGMSPFDAMRVGTAGFTAMLSVMALEELGVTPDSGPVVVTGASGGVGSVAVALLAHAGYEVHAATGSPDTHDYLRRLGAAGIVDRTELATPPDIPLGQGQWAGAVDNVGGSTLATLIATMRRHGVIAACGNAGGAKVETTVYPFILRGVVLYGVDSNTADPPRRVEAWQRLADALPALDPVETTTIGLADLPEWCERITRGATTGRVVVDVNR